MTKVLEEWNGRVLNTAAIGRQLGISHTAAARRVRAAERDGRVFLLPFYGGRRKPKLYVLPARGFQGACVDTVMRRLHGFRFHWWKTGKVRDIDLVAVAPRLRIGPCVSRTGEA